MKHIMFDLEALGTGEKPAICQIGAVYFDIETGETGDEFLVNINAGTTNGIIDADTSYWWLNQSKEAQDSILSNKVNAVEGIEAFREFQDKAVRLWSHSLFDFVVLQKTCRQLEIKYFYSRKSMDIKTLVTLANLTVKKFEREGVHHNALHDAKHQVKYTSAAYRKLKGLD